MSRNKSTIRIALFGAAPDTPNMGVSALFVSAVNGLSKHFGAAEFVVFDNGLGRRTSTLRTTGGQEITLILYGARGGRRYYRPENLATMTLVSRLGVLGAWINEGIRLIDSCDLVLDVSGGDSFSDIYGRARFDNIYRPKVIALNRGKPLILLPQTYGPYKDPVVRTLAKAVVRRCEMAWARDPDSFRRLKDLLGECFKPERHRCGVDMAFGLDSVTAVELLDGWLPAWIEESNPFSPLVGVNISGLIYNSADGGATAFGLKADYRETVNLFLRRLLDSTNVRIVLIPHVMDRPGHYESDQGACIDVVERLGDCYLGRIVVSPSTLDQSQVKWLISKMDWFCGTRMHSTIAALSSCVPTAAVSYSDKTRGVFRTCAQDSAVLDPRELGGAVLVARLLAAFHSKEASRECLQRAVPGVMQTLREQFLTIAKVIQKSHRKNQQVAAVSLTES